MQDESNVKAVNAARVAFSQARRRIAAARGPMAMQAAQRAAEQAAEVLRGAGLTFNPRNGQWR